MFKKYLLVVTLLASGSVFGGELKPYSQKEFESAQKAGKTVVLDFHADWCGTCAKQKPVLEGLLKEDCAKDTVGFAVDYDSAATLKKDLKVAKQSTIIVFKGKNEVGRSTGVTDKEQLESLLHKGM